MAAHHLGAPELLALGRELYHSLPQNALLLTIGAGSTELGEVFSDPVSAALPGACTLIEETVLRLLSE
jgi:Ni,Fe-hydrogenase maturation factor